MNDTPNKDEIKAASLAAATQEQVVVTMNEAITMASKQLARYVNSLAQVEVIVESDNTIRGTLIDLLLAYHERRNSEQSKA